MNPLVFLAFAGLAVGLTVILWRPAPPTPHQDREAQQVAALVPELRRRVEREIETRAGRGAVTAGRLGIVLLSALVCSCLLLFPFFKVGAILPAFIITVIVGQLYLQTLAVRRASRLDEQTLDLLTMAVANLSASTGAPPAQVIGELLADADPPLQEETSTILPPLQAGRDFLPTLEDVMGTTRSTRLRRMLHLWRASEEEALGPSGQAARFQALFEEEGEMETLRRETRLAARKAIFSMYVVILIIPVLIAVMMAMMKSFRTFYMEDMLGRFGLALILMLELMAIFLSRRIVQRALR